jgi:hypothetical protein
MVTGYPLPAVRIVQRDRFLALVREDDKTEPGGMPRNRWNRLQPQSFEYFDSAGVQPFSRQALGLLRPAFD